MWTLRLNGWKSYVEWNQMTSILFCCQRITNGRISRLWYGFFSSLWKKGSVRNIASQSFVRFLDKLLSVGVAPRWNVHRGDECRLRAVSKFMCLVRWRVSGQSVSSKTYYFYHAFSHPRVAISPLATDCPRLKFRPPADHGRIINAYCIVLYSTSSLSTSF